MHRHGRWYIASYLRAIRNSIVLFTTCYFLLWSFLNATSLAPPYNSSGQDKFDSLFRGAYSSTVFPTNPACIAMVIPPHDEYVRTLRSLWNTSSRIALRSIISNWPRLKLSSQHYARLFRLRRCGILYSCVIRPPIHTSHYPFLFLWYPWCFSRSGMHAGDARLIALHGMRSTTSANC